MKKVFISFDIDGTIIKPNYDDFIWYKEIPKLYAQKYGIEVEKARDIVTKEYKKIGENDIRWYIPQYWLDRFGLKVKQDEILQKYAHKIEIYEEVETVLNKLYGKYPLIISSAMPHSFIKVKLKKNNLFRYFERIFSAVSDFKMVKKESTFYKKVCERLKIPTQNLIHVGDRYREDYLAPRKAGVRAFYLDRTNNQPLSDPNIISDLLEFCSKLENYVKLL